MSIMSSGRAEQPVLKKAVTFVTFCVALKGTSKSPALIPETVTVVTSDFVTFFFCTLEGL